MKVLINRIWGLVSARLSIFAARYSWYAQTYEEIFDCIFAYFKIKLRKARPNQFRRWNNKFDRQLLKNLPYDYISTLLSLSPEKLRKVIRLCELICKFPDCFDRIFACFRIVPLVRLDRICELDREFLQTRGV